MVDKVEKIWMDGKLVDWDAAQVHVMTHTLHYGLGVFEGIRCYRTHDGKAAVFRLREHTRRLFDSAKICTIPVHNRMVSVCAPIHASGVNASEPHASAVHTESNPSCSASCASATANGLGCAPQ